MYAIRSYYVPVRSRQPHFTELGQPVINEIIQKSECTLQFIREADIDDLNLLLVDIRPDIRVNFRPCLHMGNMEILYNPCNLLSYNFV